MKTNLSLICQYATIIDFAAKKEIAYADLNVIIETPGMLHKPAHPDKRVYLVLWPDGRGYNLFSRFSPQQMQPELIERCYTDARPITASVMTDIRRTIAGKQQGGEQ